MVKHCEDLEVEKIRLSPTVDRESGVGCVLLADPYCLPYYGIEVDLSAFKTSQSSEEFGDNEQTLESVPLSGINTKDLTGPNIDTCYQQDVGLETEYKWTERKLLKESGVDEDPSMVELEEEVTVSLSHLEEDLGITYRPQITLEDIVR